MLVKLTGVIPDATYRTALQSNQNQCLETQKLGETGSIQTTTSANADSQK